MISRKSGHPTTGSPARLLLALVGLGIGFHALGLFREIAIDWSDPVGWMTNASPEIALAGALRSIGLGACYWIVITTGLYSICRRRGSASPLLRLITIPAIRRMVDGAIAGALTASLAFSPIAPAMAGEDDPEPVVFDIHDGVPVPHLQLTSSTASTLPTPPPHLVQHSSPPPQFASSRGTTAASTAAPSGNYAVEAGDNLWAIAVAQLDIRGGDSATTADIADYWRRLIAANEHSLRSGDPNLIYAGEIVAIPPIATDQ